MPQDKPLSPRAHRLTCDPNDPYPEPAVPISPTEEEHRALMEWWRRNDAAIDRGEHFSSKPGYVG